jgi:hypothetical protein
MVSTRGYTLVELIVVMAIFMAVIIISSQAFNKIISVSSQQSKSSESDTQGVIGLEMLRVDLEHAGYGLPWITSFVADFDEAPDAANSLAPGINSKDFNDKYNVSSDSNKVPRAIQAAASTSDGRDYLVIKSVLAGMSDTVKKWAYVEGIGGASRLKAWDENNLVANEQVVTIDSRTKRLVGNSMTAADYSYTLTGTAPFTPPAAFQPQSDTDAFVVYGLLPASSTVAPRAPYNRVDYYIKRPSSTTDMPLRCAPGTGILYKGVMFHGTTGGYTQYPLLECVADMQVVFNVAADGVNGVDVDQSGLAGLSAKEIRQQLKMIKIFIVAHEGGKDSTFIYNTQNIVVGEGAGRTLDLKNGVVGSDDYKNYRWKIYKLTVTPKNINY